MSDLDRLIAAGNALAASGADVSEDLAAEIIGRYAGTLNYPSQQKRYERDMTTVNEFAIELGAWRALVAELKREEE